MANLRHISGSGSVADSLLASLQIQLEDYSKDVHAWVARGVPPRQHLAVAGSTGDNNPFTFPLPQDAQIIGVGSRSLRILLSLRQMTDILMSRETPLAIWFSVGMRLLKDFALGGDGAL